MAPASARNSRLRCGLVGVAAGVRGRGGSGAAAQERRGATEAQDAPDGLRRYADVLAEAGRQVPAAATELGGERADAHAPARRLQPRPCAEQVRGRRGALEPAQQQRVQQGEARLPAGRGVQTLLELRGVAPEDRAEVDGQRTVQLVERNAQQRTGRERLQVELDAPGGRLEARRRGPVVDGGHERAEPLPRHGERRAEVDDQAHAVLRQLGADHRRRGPLLVAGVAQDGAAEQRMRRALDHPDSVAGATSSARDVALLTPRF